MLLLATKETLEPRESWNPLVFFKAPSALLEKKESKEPQVNLDLLA